MARGGRGPAREPRGRHRQSRWHSGQRGSQRARTRPIASRTVANESAKWRSGRDGERVLGTGPSGRGGKSAYSFGGHERIATDRDGDVVIPADEAAPFVVVEAQLALQLLVRPLGLPPLFDGAHDLLLGHATAQVGEEELARSALAFRPFDDEPHGLAQRWLAAVVVGGLDASENEPRAELLGGARSITPCDLTESALSQLDAELPHVDGFRAPSVLVEQPYARLGGDRDRIVETLEANEVTKYMRSSVVGVRQDDLARDPVVHSTAHQAHRQLALGLEEDRLGNARCTPACFIARPRLGYVQLDVDGHLLARGGHTEADGHLAVGDLAGASRVLSLHAGRVTALLEHARVVDDPAGDRLSLGHRRDHVPSRFASNVSIAPRGLAHEVQQPVVQPLALLRIAAGPSRDRLHALALAVTQKAERVGRERCSLILSAKMLADGRGEVVRHASGTRCVHLVAHAGHAARLARTWTTSRSQWMRHGEEWTAMDPQPTDSDPANRAGRSRSSARLDRDVRRSMHRLRYPYSALRGGPGGPGGFDTGPGDAWRLLPLRRVGLAPHVPQQRPRVVPRLDRRAAVLPDSVALLRRRAFWSWRDAFAHREIVRLFGEGQLADTSRLDRGLIVGCPIALGAPMTTASKSRSSLREIRTRGLRVIRRPRDRAALSGSQGPQRPRSPARVATGVIPPFSRGIGRSSSSGRRT